MGKLKKLPLQPRVVISPYSHWRLGVNPIIINGTKAQAKEAVISPLSPSVPAVFLPLHLQGTHSNKD